MPGRPRDEPGQPRDEREPPCPTGDPPAGRRRSTWKTIAAGAGFLAAFILAPLFGGVFILGAAAGFIADGYRAHQDDELRAVATSTAGIIDTIDVRHFTEDFGPGRTECVPQVSGTANGEPHTWDLADSAACGGVYRVGQRLEVVYDSSDVDRAVLADPEAGGVRARSTVVHVQVLVIGVVLAAVGTGCWLWVVRSGRGRRERQSSS